MPTYIPPPNHRYKHHKKGYQPPYEYHQARSINEFTSLTGIGQGAFAQVYRAYERMSSVLPAYREVALKRINLDAIQEKSVLKTTFNEVNLFKKLQHEHIVRCYYSFEETSAQSRRRYLILVMEYVDGGDLQTFLANRFSMYRMLPEQKLWKTFSQITDALSYIHQQRIIHRDLKPANVLMTAHGAVKLADFGLSRLQRAAETSVRTICGTPYYMAPERITEGPYKAQSDIWSLGCILYEMATYKSPFSGEKDNAKSLLQKISEADYPPLPQDCYSVQVGLLINACLNPQMEKRPPAKEVHRVAITMLQRCEAAAGVASTPIPIPSTSGSGSPYPNYTKSNNMMNRGYAGTWM